MNLFRRGAAVMAVCCIALVGTTTSLAQDSAIHATTDQTLLHQGELTPAGQVVFQRGLAQFEAHQDADAYQTWLPLAKAGHALSQHNLAALLVRDKGVAKNTDLARRMYELAARNGFAPAHCALGEVLAETARTLTERQHVQAVFVQGAEAGAPECMHNLGAAQLNGYAGPADVPSGLAWLGRAAQAGLISAQVSLGRALRLGSYGTKDPATARHWLQLAGDQGETDALFHLASMWRNGEGGPVDAALSRRLLERAADQGHAAATHDLALMLRQGSDTPADLPRALVLFRQAALRGSGEAYVNLGDMAYLGLAQARDPQLALSFYNAAIQAGVPWGVCRAAALARHTQGVLTPPPGLADELAQHALRVLPGVDCQQPLDQVLVP